MPKPDDKQNHDQERLEASPGLVAALQRAGQKPLFVPPSVDASILRAAQRHLAPPKPGFWKWPMLLRWGLATAFVLLLLLSVTPLFRKPQSLVRGDLNHDGRVDILDAFALATRLKSGTQSSPQLDLNGDGVVDEKDVEAIASAAVSLSRGGSL